MLGLLAVPGRAQSTAKPTRGNARPQAAAPSVAGTPTLTPAPSAALAALFHAYSEQQAQWFPFIGIYLGDHRYNDQLPNDQTRAFREQQRQAYGQHLASLHRVDRAALSATAGARVFLRHTPSLSGWLYTPCWVDKLAVTLR